VGEASTSAALRPYGLTETSGAEAPRAGPGGRSARALSPLAAARFQIAAQPPVGRAVRDRGLKRCTRTTIGFSGTGARLRVLLPGSLRRERGNVRGSAGEALDNSPSVTQTRSGASGGLPRCPGPRPSVRSNDRLDPHRIDESPTDLTLVIDVARPLAGADEDLVEQAVDIDSTG
jgi:hypothetical protein